jgi:hypothetical protein
MRQAADAAITVVLCNRRAALCLGSAAMNDFCSAFVQWGVTDIEPVRTAGFEPTREPFTSSEARRLAFPYVRFGSMLSKKDFEGVSEQY